jgi:hypothetical protein
LTFARRSREQQASFTNKIPFRGQKQQFSSTLTGVRAASERGLGEPPINDCYQLIVQATPRGSRFARPLM